MLYNNECKGQVMNHKPTAESVSRGHYINKRDFIYNQSLTRPFDETRMKPISKWVYVLEFILLAFIFISMMVVF